MTTTSPSALPPTLSPALRAELETAGLDPERVLAAGVEAVAEALPGEARHSRRGPTSSRAVTASWPA